MSKKFTDYIGRPIKGKIGLKSPILEGYQLSSASTMGQVVELIEGDENSLDRCVVNFRGENLQATCCHPGIIVGMNVCMIEQPQGVWWATVLQKSWYTRPLSDLIKKGHPFQAAAEYLLSFGDKWRPKLIIIDKRGQTSPIEYKPLDITSDFVIGYTPESWPYNQNFFNDADIDGDGFVDENELKTWLADNGTGNTVNPDDSGTQYTVELIPDSDGNFVKSSAKVRFKFARYGPSWVVGFASGTAFLVNLIFFDSTAVSWFWADPEQSYQAYDIPLYTTRADDFPTKNYYVHYQQHYTLPDIVIQFLWKKP